MEFESKALAFRIQSSEMEDPGEFLDKLVQENLDFYENLDNHEKGESATLIFEEGSKAYVYRTEGEDKEFKDSITVNYVPNEEENNYEESKKVIDSIDNALTGIGYEIDYLTVGGLLEEEIQELVDRHISIESEFDVDGIELKKENCIYGIANKTDSNKVRVTIRVRNKEEEIKSVKENLNSKLEEFVEA